MNKKVTVYDIARELKISPSTVSRVLNNSSLIGDEKRQLIVEAAGRMNYQKRSIKKQRSRAIINIRLFLPPAKYTYIHLFYDVAAMISGIQDGFSDTRVNIITSINDGDLTLFDSKKLGDIDGCIFAFTVPPEKLELLLEEREIPFILINREEPENNYVMVDSHSGMEKLVDAMWRRHREKLKPCFIGFDPLANVSMRRQEGVSAACVKRDIPFLGTDVFNIDSIKDLQGPVLDAILKHGYNAVLCFNDLLSVSVYQSILRRGLSVPGTFSLSGFDNSPMLDLMDQRIDTIEFSLLTLGTEAGKWLHRWIIEREALPTQKKIEGTYVRGETI